MWGSNWEAPRSLSLSRLLARPRHGNKGSQTATQTAIINCRSSAGGGQTGREHNLMLCSGGMGEEGIGRRRERHNSSQCRDDTKQNKKEEGGDCV